MSKLVAIAAASLLAAASVGAAERPKPLPSFTLVSSDGLTVTSTALSQEPQWLLVYVTPACPSCDRLMKALGEWRSPLIDARSVLVVGAAPAEASRYLAAIRPASLDGVASYTDGSLQAHRALQLGGAPALIGIKDGRIEWTLDGVLNDPSAVESVVRSWIER